MFGIPSDPEDFEILRELRWNTISLVGTSVIQSPSLLSSSDRGKSLRPLSASFDVSPKAIVSERS